MSLITDQQERREHSRSNRARADQVRRKASQLLAEGLTLKQVQERIRASGLVRTGIALGTLRQWAREDGHA